MGIADGSGEPKTTDNVAYEPRPKPLSNTAVYEDIPRSGRLYYQFYKKFFLSGGIQGVLNGSDPDTIENVVYEHRAKPAVTKVPANYEDISRSGNLYYNH